jgi:hypothetical protein
MKSVVELEIRAPRAKVAELFTDPQRNTQWMADIARIEPVSGALGTVGSQYRLVPKKGSMVFVATVVSRDLPREGRLVLEAANVHVSIRATFDALTADKTRLVSEEVFTFSGVVGKLMGFLGTFAIRKAHRLHMEAFKRYCEMTQHQ